MAEAWAFVAHADGKFVGAISFACGRKEVAKFCGGMAADGFSITPVFSREEYHVLIGPMGTWKPEPPRTIEKRAEQPDMFSCTRSVAEEPCSEGVNNV